jgi:ribose 5-phosphate isomerase B
MMITIGSDHAGFEYKEKIKKYLENQGFKVDDEGTYSSQPADYPDFAYKVAKKVQGGSVDFGVLICGTGIGVSIAANKVRGIRAAVVSTEFTAESAKNHNLANVICFGSRVNTIEEVFHFLDVFMKTNNSTLERHLNRVQKIKEIEEK